MKQPTSLGLNRTGISTSPLLTAEMLADMAPPSSPGDMTQLFKLRKSYLESSEPFGTVPPPVSVKGVATTISQRLKGARPEVFLDKLGERAAFERTGVRLYDLLLNKCMNQPQENEVSIATLEKIREDEASHYHMLVNTILDLGGDPTVMTPGADANGVMSMGLVQVLVDPRITVPYALQAILIAELADNDGWSLLIELASELGQKEIVGNFHEALLSEEQHLAEIRAIYNNLVKDEASYIH